MKKKVGTIIDEEILVEAKTRAAREQRPLADLIQEALVRFLHEVGPNSDAEHSCCLFCSDGGQLGLEELSELLEEDILAV